MISFKDYVFLSFLNEELTPAQKRKVDKWAANITDKSYSHSHKVFGSSTNTRLTIPLEGGDTTEVSAPAEVIKFLSSKGYNVSGDIASRKVRVNHPTLGVQEKEVQEKIGKELEKTGASNALKNQYANSISKQGSKLNSKDLKVIISRHPYDVAGMSTDRGWTSCMHLDSGYEADHLEHEIKNGTHVAYLVKKDDTNIDHPIARIALKQYDNEKGEVAMMPDKVYGLNDSNFINTVNAWAKKHFPFDNESSYWIRLGSYADEVPYNVTRDFEKKLTSDVPEVLAAAIKHPNVTPEHIDKALDYHFRNVRVAAINHPNASEENINKALQDEDTDVRVAAIQNPNATIKNISKAMQDKDRYIRDKALQHPKVTAELITKVLDGDDIDLKYRALQHPNCTAEHITKALDDPDKEVRTIAIRHANATVEHISKALVDRNTDVRYFAIQHPNCTAEHITKALDDPDWDTRRAAIKNPKATAEHITKALQDKELGVRLLAVKHTNATAEHINKALDDESETIRIAAALHPNASEENISKALDDENQKIRHAAIQNPNVNGEHISKAQEDKVHDIVVIASRARLKFEQQHQASSTHEQALRMGLEYYGFGRYGRNKLVTHKTRNGVLIKV